MPEISIQWGHLLHQLNTYQGQYEYHLTVDLEPNNTQQLHAFETLCTELNAKAIVIQLASGETPPQPMLGQFLEGQPKTVLSTIQTAAEKLQQQFTLTRVKVEASTKNSNIPKFDEDASELPISCYFEHHVKMRLPSTVKLQQLRAELMDYQGHLSRNAYTQASSSSDLESRFVTQRIWSGNHTAKQRLDNLLNYLQERDIPAAKVIREYNIFDP